MAPFWIDIFIIAVLCCEGAATIAQNVNEYTSVSELRSEQFEICHRKVQLSCPGSPHDREIRMMSCGYECASDMDYQCKEDKDRGIIEFCAKTEICEPGQMNKVYFDDRHKKVVIEKDICQAKYFQPFAVNCYTACTQFRHEDKRFLEVWGIKVLYHGNNTHAGVGYCDADHGYVSAERKMYTSLEHKAVIACDKRDDFNSTCGENKRLLPDGNCSDKCEKGYVVDIWNSFQCSKQSSDNRSVIFQSTFEVFNTTPSHASNLNENHIISNDTSSSQKDHGQTYTVVIAVLGSVIGILIVIFVIYCIVKNRKTKSETRNGRRGKPKRIRETKNNKCTYNKIKTENGDIIIHVSGKVSRKSSSDTGVYVEDRSGDVPSQEDDHISLESGYQTVHANEQIEMEVMKSLSYSDDVDVDREDVSNINADDKEQTQLMKVY